MATKKKTTKSAAKSTTKSTLKSATRAKKKATRILPEKIGIGIIGAGGIARAAHLPGYEAAENAEIIAISDPVEAARTAASEQFSIPHSYTDFHEMLARDDIHAVSVTTPNFLHAEATIAALEAGKHVLCEKPLAMNAKEGEAMVAAAERSGMKLMCGFNNRFDPSIQTLKRFAEDGRFGNMYYTRAQALRRRGIPGWGLFISKEKNGGGPLIDIGVHILDAALHILGFPKVVAVSGQTYQKFGKRGDVLGLMGQWDYKNFTVEDFAAAFVRFEDGSTMVLESSFMANQEDRSKMSFQIYGDAGGCSYGPLKMFTEENQTLLDITPVHLPQGVKTHHEEMKSFVNSVVNDEPVFTPGTEALQVTRIIDAIYESGKKGEEVRL